jgi:hypothetical protein
VPERIDMKYTILIAVPAISLTACATAVAPSAPKIRLDCGSLPGSGVIRIDIDDMFYPGQIDCGQLI